MSKTVRERQIIYRENELVIRTGGRFLDRISLAGGGKII